MKRYREYLGLTQEYVATALGIKREELASFESGETLELEKLNKLSNLYGVPVNMLTVPVDMLTKNTDTELDLPNVSQHDKSEIKNLIEFQRRIANETSHTYK